MSLAHDDPIVKFGEVTRDAFLDGRLTITQPKSGFRAGLDSVLLGAAVGEGRRRVLDLGAGAGTASLVALTLDPAREAVLIDSDPQTVALADANLSANGFASRARAALLDVTGPARARSAAGLAAESFDAIIANPPFYDRGTRAAPARAAARAMPAGGLELWAKAAASLAAAGAEIIFIHTADRLPELLAAFGRFGALTVLPLTPHAGEPAHRVLVRGIKGSRAPLSLLASRPLHAASGFVPEFESIFRGRTRLHW